MSASAAPDWECYDRTTVGLHWIVAAGVLVQWFGAHAIDLFPKGPLRVDARSVHLLVGVTLLVLMGCSIRRSRRPGQALQASWPHEVASSACDRTAKVALYADQTLPRPTG